jgi:hypothetical protein
MSQDDVMSSIQSLAHEERNLREREARGEISDEERERRRWIDLRLDQCWDFLRQRRARLSAALIPKKRAFARSTRSSAISSKHRVAGRAVRPTGFGRVAQMVCRPCPTHVPSTPCRER